MELTGWFPPHENPCVIKLLKPQREKWGSLHVCLPIIDKWMHIIFNTYVYNYKNSFFVRAEIGRILQR